MNRRVLGSIAVVIAALLLLGAWQLGLLTPEPEEVNLADAVSAETGGDEDSQEPSDDAASTDPTTSSTTADTTTTTSATTSSDESDAGDDSGSAAPCAYQPPDGVDSSTQIAVSDLSELDGTWLVRESDSTFAGYRIDEILSGADFTAVGRTRGVSGAITIEASNLAAADIAVDLVGLTSDSRIRDGQLKRQALETNNFPTGCFTLTEPITISALPSDGTSFTADAEGTLHLHGASQPVTIAIEATTSEGLLFVIGSTELALADFGIDKPQAPSVADVSDTATMEFSLVLSR